jgi:murein DD-endopeptidase MepM/ murein hydrolase activator NlpD
MLWLLAATMMTAGGSYAFCPSGNTKASKHSYFPLPGAKVISSYGKRGGRMHTGVDLKTKPNDTIYAAFDGEVVFSGKYYAYGNLIRIMHANALETYYGHNSKNLVEKGQQVKAGQAIAIVGQTGRATTPHLHFETRINGKHTNPSKYIKLPSR